MQRTHNRILSLLLVVVMVLSMLPVIASATEQSPAAEYVALNAATGEQYTDVSDALKSAAEDQTVKLTMDATDSGITVRPNTTLDLNGYKLECKNFSCFGSTVDSSAANTGLLVPSRVAFSGTNEQIAIHNGTGYQFFQVLGFNTKEVEGGKFVFQPLFEEGAHTLLKAGNAVSGTKIEIHVGYQVGKFTKTAIFYYSDAMVQSYLDSYANGKYEKMFTLSVNNAAEFGELTFTPAVASKAGITINPAKISVDANGQLTEDVTLQNGQNSAVVGAGSLLEGGNLTLTTSELTESQANVELGAEETLTSLDVHVEGLSKDNTVPVLVTLTEIAPESLNKGNIHLYHVENGKTVEMTRVYSLAELDAHNEFYYDIVTGTVTVALCSFSEIAVRTSDAKWTGEVDHSWYKTAPATKNTSGQTYYIYNADQLWSFSQIVGGMAEGIAQDSFAGKTVVLYADIDLDDLTDENDRVFYPIGYYNSEKTYEKSEEAISSGFYTFKGTFDGNGHTIQNFYQNTWEMKGDHDWYPASQQRYRDGMGLFGKVYGGTVKNLTVENFSSDGEITTTGTIAAYADCGATFENIAIFNCNPRVYNIGNGGIVGCVGWYAHEQGDQKVTFKNITVDNTNKISALWGSWDVACGGLVGQYYPTSGQSEAVKNLGIRMENCHVAAQIDVYNDVCANYQYYAYRYAGMLIGSVRENVPIDGREYPKMDGITAAGCTVHFGDWNDYYYCELEANSLASYSEDYQFSRLTQVDEITDEMRAGTGNYVIVKGDHATENATCYHFVNGNEYTHTEEEDKQHIYLEFNNLVTGYGWGVTSKGVDDMDGVTIIDKEAAAQKFDIYKDAKTTYGTGAIIKLSDLFYSQHTVKDAAVQVFVSPVGKDSTVTGTYTADKENWKNGTLTINGKGAAEIIITDYYFCKETKLAITVNEYTVSFAVPDSADAIAPMKSGEYGITLPVNHSFTNAGIEYTLVGWVEAPITEITSAEPKNLLESPYIAAKNTLLYPVYTYSEVTAGETSWTLVKDASTLKAGDQIIIAASGSNHALGTTQNSNNRAAVTITKSGETISNPGSTVQILTLEAGTKSNTFAFNTGSGYLYAASSSSNYLRTETKLSDNSSWTIAITSAGVATVTAKGTNTRNLLKKNSSSALFACYSSGQNDIAIYKKTNSGDATAMYGSFVDGCEHNYENGICTICSKNEPSVYTLTDIGQISEQQNVIITMTNSEGETYALSNGNGGSKAPTAVLVDVVAGEIENTEENILWNIVNNEDDLTIYPAGTTESWLYCINDNNGVRVGTGEDKTFIIDSTYGYLFNEGQSRYIGVYDKQDWRSYTTTPDGNNIKDQTLTFWVQKVNCTHANKVDVEAVAPGCENPGYTTCQQCSDCGTYFNREEIPANGHTEVIDAAVAATCSATGLTEGKHCSVCDKVLVAQVEVPVIDHNYVNGTCDVCGAEDPNSEKPETSKEITFNLGNNGSASHSDGTSQSSYTETVNDYTLSIANGTKMNVNATDEKGNSCLKLGTNSSTGSFSFTVPNDVTSVVIMIGKYKSNTSKVTINGTTYTLTNASNDGAYDEITVDTTNTKTVSVATASGGVRAMVNTIIWKVSSNSGNEGGETPNTTTATLSFADATQRTTWSAEQQVWSSAPATLTNDRNGATSAIVDATNPAKFYAGSKLTISCIGMTQIVFDCNNSSYATALKNSIGTVSGVTVTVSSDKVTVTFTNAVESFVIATLSAQVRLDSLTVTYQG